MKKQFCPYCGTKLDEGARFCTNCGEAIYNAPESETPPEHSSTERTTERKTVYEGYIHKCPNCGEMLNSFISNCPVCGYELRGTSAVNSVEELYKNIQTAKNDNEVIRLIKMFPIPNSREDIIEFMVLASSNFNEEHYIAHMGEEGISSAWLSKIEQCHKKATLTLGDADILRINEIYNSITLRIADAEKRAKQRHASRRSEEGAKEFKKSRFRRILIVFSIISVLFCVVAFQSNKLLAGIIAILMTALSLVSFLMGSGVVKECVKNFRLIPAILAFLLLVPYFSLFEGTNTVTYKEPNTEPISWDSLILGRHLPNFGYPEAEVIWDTDNVLILYFHNVEGSKYKSYVEECKDFGYTIDSEYSDANYKAYNREGYHLYLHYSGYSEDKKITIDLDDPIKREQITWPKSDLVKNLPVPKSLIGEVSTERSNAYSVYLLQLEPSYFSEYVALCMDNGFNIDYSKSDTYFSAENKNGISLTVEYEGFNTLHIYITGYN